MVVPLSETPCNSAVLKIVFLERQTICTSVHFAPTTSAHEYFEYDRTRPEDVLQRLTDATIAIINKTRLSRELLEALPSLKMIAITATGTDNIDLATCARLGIQVANVRGYADDAVPEHTFALILALRRSLLNYREDVLRGEWSKAEQFCLQNYNIQDLSGSTLGIFGRGAHGLAVARIAESFKMRVCFAERKDSSSVRPGYTAFDQVLAESDVLSLHCPLTLETKALLGHREFSQMERKPLLINVSRGALIDNQALISAVRNGVVSGVGLDVLDQEPPSEDHSLLTLTSLPNVILTPHVAWASEEAQQRLMDETAANIEAFIKESRIYKQC